jgi:RNA polymerase sigma-70 factor (family 1)
MEMMLRFRKLVDQYRHRIYTFACYYLGDREAAEDVTQEVLLRLWKHHQQIESARLTAWVIRVTRNACYDAIRKRRSYRALVTSENDGTEVESTAADDPDPQAVVEAADFEEHLKRALANVSEPYRTIVVLREIQDMKYEQIASALDMPLNTVKAYLHRGRRLLRDQLREVVGDELF